jgi:hypothetical protein
MEGEREIEYIPVHSSAFALRLPLREGHETEDDARREHDALMQWLRRESGEAA